MLLAVALQPRAQHGDRGAQILLAIRREGFDEFETVTADPQQEGGRRSAAAIAGNRQNDLRPHDMAGEPDIARRQHRLHRERRRPGAGGVDEPHDIMRRHVDRVLDDELVIVLHGDMRPSQPLDPGRRRRPQPVILPPGIAVAKHQDARLRHAQSRRAGGDDRTIRILQVHHELHAAQRVGGTGQTGIVGPDRHLDMVQQTLGDFLAAQIVAPPPA